MNYNGGKRGGRGDQPKGRSGKPYGNGGNNMVGAARRTYPIAGPGPRVGRIEKNVPRAERVGGPEERPMNRFEDRHGGRTENKRGGYMPGRGEFKGDPHSIVDPKKRNMRPAQPPRPPRAERVGNPPDCGGINPQPPIPPEFPMAEPPAPHEFENILCGRNPIREALRVGSPVEKLLVATGDLSGAARDIIKMARDAGVIVQMVDRARLDQIYPAHQGLLAYVAAVPYSTVDAMLDDAAEKGEDPFLIILDGITDPHNLGAIVRTAECVGAHGVIIPERRAVGLTPAAAKAAAGALSHMKIARVTNINRTIDELKEHGVWVLGTSLNGESSFTADLTGPVALVIGSEGDGISRLTMEKCDRLLTLPMKGHLDSLNASVAAGVLMYEVARARAL